MEVPDQASGGERAQHVVRAVDLPPAEALARRHLVVMVVVVPALAHGDECEHEVVARVVVGGVAAAAPQVRERVDRERAVPAQHLGHRERPHQAEEAAEYERDHAHRDRRQHPVAIEPAQLGIPREVLDARIVRALEIAGEDPAHVRPPEARLLHRVKVTRHVGELVMHAVVCRPPQHALLRGRRRAEREHELEPARGLVAAVREVAVVSPGDEEHPRHVERGGQREAEPRQPGERDADDREHVHSPEGQGERVEVDVAPTLRLSQLDPAGRSKSVPLHVRGSHGHRLSQDRKRGLARRSRFRQE